MRNRFAGELRSAAGITIIELLIASTILVTILGSLGGLYVSSSRAYQANRSTTASSGQLRSAVQALQYDVSLAGYCGTASQCNLPSALELTVSTEGELRRIDSLESSYVEDRYTGSAAAQTIRYTLRDGRLMRSEGGANAVAIAEGITTLELLGYRSRTSTNPNEYVFQRPPSGDLAGLELRLHYVQDGQARTETISVNLQNAL